MTDKTAKALAGRHPDHRAGFSPSHLGLRSSLPRRGGWQVKAVDRGHGWVRRRMDGSPGQAGRMVDQSCRFGTQPPQL